MSMSGAPTGTESLPEMAPPSSLSQPPQPPTTPPPSQPPLPMVPKVVITKPDSDPSIERVPSVQILVQNGQNETSSSSPTTAAAAATSTNNNGEDDGGVASTSSKTTGGKGSVRVLERNANFETDLEIGQRSIIRMILYIQMFLFAFCIFTDTIVQRWITITTDDDNDDDTTIISDNGSNNGSSSSSLSSSSPSSSLITDVFIYVAYYNTFYWLSLLWCNWPSRQAEPFLLASFLNAICFVLDAMVLYHHQFSLPLLIVYSIQLIIRPFISLYHYLVYRHRDKLYSWDQNLLDTFAVSSKSANDSNDDGDGDGDGNGEDDTELSDEQGILEKKLSLELADLSTPQGEKKARRAINIIAQQVLHDKLMQSNKQLLMKVWNPWWMRSAFFLHFTLFTIILVQATASSDIDTIQFCLTYNAILFLTFFFTLYQGMECFPIVFATIINSIAFILDLTVLKQVPSVVVYGGMLTILIVRVLAIIIMVIIIIYRTATLRAIEKKVQKSIPVTSQTQPGSVESIDEV